MHPLTVLRVALIITIVAATAHASAAETFYLSPDGSDDHAGTTSAAAWRTFGHAFSKLEAGDELVLLDGVYTPDVSGRFFADGFDGVRSGSASEPITVRAQNERRAWIQSDGLDAAVLLQNLEWWQLSGLRASNQDNPAAERGGEGLKLINCRNITIRRGLFHHNNRYRNSQMVMIVLSRDVLVEESEIYYFHRNGFEAYRSEDVVFRRLYADSRGHADLPDGRGSHTISDDGGDRAFVGYHASNLLVENSISEDRTEGFGFISGLPTNVVDPKKLAERPPDELDGYEPDYFYRIAESELRASGIRARFLGIISMYDNMGGAVQSREADEGSQPISDVLFENFLMLSPIRTGFVSRAAHDLAMRHVMAINGTSYDRWSGNAFSLSTTRQGQWPSCEAIRGCTYRLSHWLIAGNEGTALSSVPSQDGSVDFRITYSNFFDNGGGVGLEEDLADQSGGVRKSAHRKPTGIGSGEGECLVFVPENSNMHAAGRDGADIGANILYRYEDGELTDQPLWDPSTGAFPHGAVIEGMNDTAGASLFDVHERLHVNASGCRLPYSR